MTTAGRRPSSPWHVLAVSGFGVLLVIQGYLSFAADPEPYPTIRMPHFGHAAARDGTMPVTFARIEAAGSDGSTRAIAPSDLMGEFRFSAARPSFDSMFRDADPAAVDPEVRAWLRARIGALHEGFHPVEVRMCWQEARVGVTDASIAREGPCPWKAFPL